ncbi:MAG TPA: aminotransferase class IV [Tepidisphaeraceae bacterium]|nr:aminotransferase class IV [Tepidisphaeraceae bacterium]
MLQRYDARNADLIVNVNGRLVRRDEAAVSPFDSSVQNGDAVWEGLRLYDGRIFRLRQHLARLRKSAGALRYEGYPVDDYLVQQLARTLAANGMTDGVHVRLTVTRGVKYTSGLDPRVNTGGCSLIILAEHKPPVFDKGGIALVTATVRRPFADVLDQHIHSCNQLTSILAKLQANAAGADDALLLDPAGFVAETSATHVFMVKGGTVITPTTRACPEGITRAAVLELCASESIAHEVRDVTPEEFTAADELFCTGTMGELVPVTRIDHHAFARPGPGSVFELLSRRFSVLARAADEGTAMSITS